MRIFTWLKALVVFIALFMAGYSIFNSDWFQREYIYPFPYREIVLHYAQQNDLDPHLVAAIVYTESKFISKACSPKGAVGLMQVMPETGQWVAGQLNYDDYTSAMLTEPETNIRFGTWYIASLKKEFRGNEILALAAYNGGGSNVKQWMRQFGWSADFQEIEQIPFPETRDYVRKVLYCKTRYQELYGL